MDSKKEEIILKNSKKQKKRLRMEYICNQIDDDYASNPPSKSELLERYRILAERKYRVYEILPQVFLGFVLGLLASVVYNLIQNPNLWGLVSGIITTMIALSGVFVSLHIVFKINKKLFEEYELKVIQKQLDKIVEETKLQK